MILLLGFDPDKMLNWNETFLETLVKWASAEITVLRDFDV